MGVEENAENDAALSQLVGVDFEVFGRVQGEPKTISPFFNHLPKKSFH